MTKTHVVNICRINRVTNPAVTNLGAYILKRDSVIMLSATKHHEGGVDSDSVEPARERRLSFEAVDFSVDGDKHILENLFRVFLVTGKANCKVVRLLSVAVK